MQDASDIKELEGEKILLVVRRHWIALVFPIFLSIVLSGIAVLGFYALVRGKLPIDGQPFFGVLALLALLALAFLILIANIRIYKQNRLILVEKKVYLIIQNTLASRNITEFTLDEIQNVRAPQTNILANLLDYGNVIIETAGPSENIDFAPAADPQGVVDAILDQHGGHEKGA